MTGQLNSNEASHIPGDSRRQPRCKLAVEVRIRVARNGRPTVLEGRSLEVTTVGMSATCEGELFPGEVVMIAIAGGHTGLALNLRAMVLNRAHSRYGFKFFRLSNEEREHLRRMVVSAS